MLPSAAAMRVTIAIDLDQAVDSSGSTFGGNRQSASGAGQLSDNFINMRLNAGAFQNLAHLHLKVWVEQNGYHEAMMVRAIRGPALGCVHTKHSQKAGPFSDARLKMDLPFRVHRRSASPLSPLALLFEFRCVRAAPLCCADLSAHACETHLGDWSCSGERVLVFRVQGSGSRCGLRVSVNVVGKL